MAHINRVEIDMNLILSQLPKPLSTFAPVVRKDQVIDFS
jgi:hypothetical protein